MTQFLSSIRSCSQHLTAANTEIVAANERKDNMPVDDVSTEAMMS